MKKARIALCVVLGAAVCAAGALLLNIFAVSGGVSHLAGPDGGSGIPAGAVTLIFFSVCLAFLAGLGLGSPDWSLAVLALEAGITAFRELSLGPGLFSLPEWLLDAISSRWLALVPLALSALYLTLNRKRKYWRFFGWTLLLSAAAALLFCLLPPLLGRGRARLPAGWSLRYLTAVCAGITLFAGIRDRLTLRGEAQALALRQSALAENCKNLERSVQETSILRHDWKNQIAGLTILAQRGDLDRLRRVLDQMDVRLKRLSPRRFCENFTVNVLLRNAAARAADAGIAFNAAADLPEELDMEDADLCSLLLSMLSCAVDAASLAPEGRREIDVTLRLNRSFLAVKCVASGTLTENEDLSQMRRVAEKYSAILDVSRTDTSFTLQTALNLSR